MTAQGCSWLREVAAELALGLLTGDERAEALAHLERCGDCQAEVAALTAVGEQLLLLAPEVPPPPGFESRVLARLLPAPEDLSPLGSSGAGWARRRPTRLLAAAAAVVVVLALVVGGWATFLDRGDTVAVTHTELRVPRGRVVGELTMRHSSPLVMEVDITDWLDGMEEHGASLEDRWWLSVKEKDGSGEMYALDLARREPLEVTMHEGIEAEDLTEVAVVDDTGEVWCSGRLPT